MSNLFNSIKNSYFGTAIRNAASTIALHWPFLLLTGAAYWGGYTEGQRGNGPLYADIIIISTWIISYKTIELLRNLGKYDDPNKFDVAQKLGREKSTLESENSRLHKEILELELKLHQTENDNYTNKINNALDQYQNLEREFLHSTKNDIIVHFKKNPKPTK